jgi:hypothetical protein
MTYIPQRETDKSGMTSEIPRQISASWKDRPLHALLAKQVLRHPASSENLKFLKQLYLEFALMIHVFEACAVASEVLKQSCAEIDPALAEEFSKWHSRAYKHRLPGKRTLQTVKWNLHSSEYSAALRDILTAVLEQLCSDRKEASCN